MWQREVIGRQTYLNTQDAVFEILTKTPEDILCKSADAIKIDLMIKQSAVAEPDPKYGVRFVPYRNVATNIVTDPNASKNFSRNVALAVAFIAADRDDWHKFIPIGMRTRVLDAKKKREAEIVAKQNMPYQSKPAAENAAEGEEEEEDEFANAYVCNRSDDDDDDDDGERNDDDKGEEEEEEEEANAVAVTSRALRQLLDADEDDDVDDKVLRVFDHKTGKFVPATTKEKAHFDGTVFGGGIAEKSSGDKDHTDELLQRLARTRQEQQQQIQEEGSTLPSDRKRRQAATLSDPQCEANLSEITQRFTAATTFDLQQERQTTREKEFGVDHETEMAKQRTKDVLQRFAPTPQQQPKPAPAPEEGGRKFTVQELMQFGAKTQLPPSIAQQIDANKNNANAGQSQQPQQQQLGQPPQQQQAAQPTSTTATAADHQVQVKLRAIRRKQLELMQLLAELEDMVQK
jgi:hypothetical protein